MKQCYNSNYRAIEGWSEIGKRLELELFGWRRNVNGRSLLFFRSLNSGLVMILTIQWLPIGSQSSHELLLPKNIEIMGHGNCCLVEQGK